MGKLDEVVSKAAPTEQHWRSLIPAKAKPATGKIELAALMHLSIASGIGAGRWVQQFAFGFPLLGEIPKTGRFPPNL